METKLKIEELSPELRDALKKEFEAEIVAYQQRTSEERKAYKELVNESIPALFSDLKKASDHLAKVKQSTFDGLKNLIAMKAEVFGRTQDQFTHSFTTDEGITLIVGCRVTDNWDDTVTAGLKKVDDYLMGLIDNEKTAMLVGFINDLLIRDKKGNLNSKNVLRLRKKADEIGDPVFIDAIKIILDAWKPIKGAAFVTVRYKDNSGIAIDLPLDISSAKLTVKDA